jgi:hypothetical protein
MEMWGQNLIISQKSFGWVNASYQIGFANNRSKHERKAKSVSISDELF